METGWEQNLERPPPQPPHPPNMGLLAALPGLGAGCSMAMQAMRVGGGMVDARFFVFVFVLKGNICSKGFVNVCGLFYSVHY